MQGAGMGARIAESALYGHLWGTDELRDVFGEEARIRDWVWILVELAEAQGELGTIEALLLGLAERHRDTPMAGRTHGQPGAPVTFGLKMAGFADEVRRHLERMRQGAPRWLVGQLGGAVGALGFFGEQAIPLRRRFCERVGLGDPGISWLTSRDRVAEFAVVLTLVCSTLGRFGNEVLELQQPEIGEVA